MKFPLFYKKPMIDIESDNGLKLKHFVGNIKFEKVAFHYPSREDIKILKNVNFEIKAGQKVAFVGLSGCGKSTCIQLLQRFYNPTAGRILIDNHDICDLNIDWWRQNIGVVNQEPVLFSTTISENIRMGKEDATDIDIQTAAKNAYAHDFIMELPEVNILN